MISRVLSFACSQSMNNYFETLLGSYAKDQNSSFVSDMQRQRNTDNFVRDFQSFIFSDTFWNQTKENALAYVSANKLELPEKDLFNALANRHLLHKDLANGFLSFISNIANNQLENISNRTTLSYETKTQLFKEISHALVKDSADIVQIKLLSETVKQDYVNNLLCDPAFIHLINMSNNVDSLNASAISSFAKLFNYYDGQYPQNLMMTGIHNIKGQHFMGYMRDLGNGFNGDLFATGLKYDDISNSLAYKLVLNSDNCETWVRFVNSLDLTKYTYSDDNKKNAFVHFIKSISDIADFAQFKQFLNGLNLANFRQMGNPDFLKTLNHKDASFVFNAFLERYSSAGMDLKSLEGYLKPQILTEYPFILQAMLERSNTRDVVFDFCLKNDISPVTYASKVGLDVKPLVNGLFGQNSEETVNRILANLSDKIAIQPEDSIAKAKSIYQAIEFRMFLYKCGTIRQSSVDKLIDDIEILSREFRENLQSGLTKLGPVTVNVEDIISGSKWTGDIEIERLHRTAARVISHHNIEHSLNLPIADDDIVESDNSYKPY